jgi:hypothetical protein
MKLSKKNKLISLLQKKINKFNKKSDRKLRINFNQQTQMNPNYYNNNNNNNNPQNMANYQGQYYNPNMNNNYQNTNQNQNNRNLFLGGMISSVTGAAGGLVGGAGNLASKAAGGVAGAAKDVGGGLLANGGAGAGLLGAGAGLAMAFGGKAKEREEISNLEQDLRTKEMRFQMERGKKMTEMDELDRRVKPFI